MDNKILFGIMCILFNGIGVPLFLQGKKSDGIRRIVFGVITLGIIYVINGIMGIILGIQVLTMSDEEFEAKKFELFKGIPGLKKAEEAPAEEEKVEEAVEAE